MKKIDFSKKAVSAKISIKQLLNISFGRREQKSEYDINFWIKKTRTPKPLQMWATIKFATILETIKD